MGKIRQYVGNKLDNLFYLNARELERPTSGLVNAGKEICSKLEQARSKL